jgi:hypothetical protein
MATTLITFLMAQANFEPTFSCINTLTIRKSSYYSSYLPAYEDGTDRLFRNVGIQNSDAGELPRRKHTILLLNLCGVFPCAYAHTHTHTHRCTYMTSAGSDN